jgi:hypothetical protein
MPLKATVSHDRKSFISKILYAENRDMVGGQTNPVTRLLNKPDELGTSCSHPTVVGLDAWTAFLSRMPRMSANRSNWRLGSFLNEPGFWLNCRSGGYQ